MTVNLLSTLTHLNLRSVQCYHKRRTGKTWWWQPFAVQVGKKLLYDSPWIISCCVFCKVFQSLSAGSAALLTNRPRLCAVVTEDTWSYRSTRSMARAPVRNQFRIIHRPGRSHANADAMSPRPNTILENVVATIKVYSKDNPIEPRSLPEGNIAVEQRSDPLLKRIFQWKSNGSPELSEILSEWEDVKKLWHMLEQIVVSENVLYRERYDGIRQLLLPKNLRFDFIKMCPQNMSGEHMGVRRTRMQVWRRAYWASWSKDTFCSVNSAKNVLYIDRDGRPSMRTWTLFSVGRLGKFCCRA